MQLYVVNISLCHLVLHFLSLQSEQTALHLASESGLDKVCQVLLQAGADVQAADFVSTIILILSTLFTVGNFIQSLISRGYLKNHCTNTRLVCTHLNAVFYAESNYGNEKFGFQFFFEKVVKFLPVICTRHPRGEG